MTASFGKRRAADLVDAKTARPLGAHGRLDYPVLAVCLKA
jgi:hypothetical protein